MESKIKTFLLSRSTPHVCSRYSCGTDSNGQTIRRPNHANCFELDSDDFITATAMTEKRYDGTPQAPD